MTGTQPALRTLTRFAPSPTGQLHLGHVAAMLYVWGLAACHKAALHVRIEDHDRQRCRAKFIDELRDDLDWLGFAPVPGRSWSQQSGQTGRYRQALSLLRDRGLIYACRCSRKDLQPSPESFESRYPGNCRELNLPESEETCLRVRLPDGAVQFYDARHGWQTQHPQGQCGDMVVRDRLGQWTYQFAVVVDDLQDDVNWIIRGDDLLASTGRQLLLADLLGRQTPLHFFHHPLVVNPEGTKLSKRDAAAPIRNLRGRGWPPEEVIGQAAFRVGLLREPAPLTADQAGRLFVDWSNGELFQSPYTFDRASQDFARRA